MITIIVICQMCQNFPHQNFVLYSILIGIRYRNTQPIIIGANMVHIQANMLTCAKCSRKEKACQKKKL